MAYTVGTVITRARAAIGDADGVRASTATCEGYVQDAIHTIRGARPDLFLSKHSTNYTALASADAFPMDAQYLLPVAYFVGAMIEHQDEQSADRARGELLMKIAGGLL